MKKILWLTAAAILAVPAVAIAQHDDHGPMGPKEPTTRAELLKQLDARFAEIDTNKDGVITRAEADAHHEAMKKQWAAKRAERRDEHFAAMDTDKNGQISKAEFDAFHAARAEKWAEGRKEGQDGPGHGMGPRPDKIGHDRMGRGMMRHGMKNGDMFARLDANKDGKVTKAEFTAKPLAMFDKADTNKDGTVTPEERKAAWDKMRAEWKNRAAKPAA